jgi:hypothetical protein
MSTAVRHPLDSALTLITPVGLGAALAVAIFGLKLPPIGEVRPCAEWARDARFERGTIPLGPFSADLDTDRPHEVAVLHLES